METKIYRAKNGFDGMSESLFQTEVGTILEAMLGNTHFPAQQTLVDKCKTEYDQFVILRAQAAYGSREAKAARNASRSRLTALLHLLGYEITAVANGNIELLASTKFPFTGVSQKTPDMVTPAKPVVTLGANPGELIIKGKRQKGSNGYTFFISDNPADPTSWKSCASSKGTFVFSDLKNVHQYYIKYALNGVRNQVVISDVVKYATQ